MKLPVSPWRCAASLIVAAPKTSEDYSILMLKRSAQAKFAGSAFVFPGGTLHESDCDGLWNSVFTQATGRDVSSIAISDFTFPNSVKPNMMDLLTDVSEIPPTIAMRICAIRETFEESGLLLVKPGHSSAKKSTSINAAIKKQWRELIQQDAHSFARLCLEHDLVPDIWSLYEWSNWLTPATVSKRFDTIFYICTLPEWPHDISADQSEVSHYQCLSPVNYLDLALAQSIFLMVPQVYELSRLLNFATIHEVKRFASERQLHGTEQWAVQAVMCADGLAMIYPGDELYETCDPKESRSPLKYDQTVKHFITQRATVNCTYFQASSGNYPRFHVTCSQHARGHLPPINYKLTSHTATSHL